MAQLSPTKYRVLDDLGDPVSGAYLFVYEQNTTTAASIFTDAGLTTPASNPVGPSDAEGYFSQFYATSGETFDLQCRRTSSAASELFWEELDVESTGSEDDATFARDFGANGRLSAAGGSGVVRLQFGPPTGDDIGGGAVISGQAGTDLDTGEWRGPLEVTGTLDAAVIKLGGVTEPFPRLLVTGTATAAATTDIALSSAFNSYELELRDITTSVGATIQVRFSFDNGATYKDGTDYLYEGFYQGNASLSNIAVSTAASISLTAGGIETTAGGCNVIARFTSKSGQYTRVISNFANFIPGTVTGCVSGQMSGTTDDNTFGKATHVRVLTSTGTASFTYSLTGRP